MSKKILSVFLTVIGGAGAGMSVAMLISSIRFSEWGRVILYCLTLAICVELVILNIAKLKPEKNQE